MKQVLFFTFITFFTFILTLFIRKYAIKKSIIDKPNKRSSHSLPTPRGGGLSIVISFYIGLILLFFQKKVDNQLYFALLSGLPLAIVSIIDDIVSLSPKIRFITQLFSSAIAIYFLNGLQIFDLSFIKCNWIFSLLAVFGIIWFINLYNFIDGIDGYASMETIFVSGTLYYFTKSEIALLLTIATLGFIPWNWQRAKIFLGDIGSTFLGFIIVILGIYYQNKSEFSFINWLVLTSLFWFDATFTLFRRWKNKEKLSEAHRKHAYQRIVQAGWSHQKTTIVGIIINLLFLIIMLTFEKMNIYPIYSLLISIIILILLTLIIDKKKPFNLS